MNDRDLRSVEKILEYCDSIKTFLESCPNGLDDYRADVRTQYACDMCVIQIGELVGRLSEEFKSSLASVPWTQIRAMRNIYARDYESVNIRYVWTTLTRDVPALRKILQNACLNVKYDE